jgi:hypothetical protein
MEFYAAMKKNEILLFTSKWMELENIILSKVSQAQKAKSHMFSLKCSNIIGRGTHTMGRTHTGGIGKDRNPKLESVCVPTVDELI